MIERSRRQSGDPLERLDTPRWVTRALIENLPCLPGFSVLEPCAGASAISTVLREEAHCHVLEFDIAPRSTTVIESDTLAPLFWQRAGDILRPHMPHVAVVTNPPFSGAAPLLRYALGAKVPLVILLVRLTWLEAANDRADLPDPHSLIIVPRPKFIESPEAKAIREAAGKPWGGDNCTVAWAVWCQGWAPQFVPRIVRVNRQQKAVFERQPVMLAEGAPRG